MYLGTQTLQQQVENNTRNLLLWFQCTEGTENIKKTKENVNMASKNRDREIRGDNACDE